MVNEGGWCDSGNVRCPAQWVCKEFWGRPGGRGVTKTQGGEHFKTEATRLIVVSVVVVVVVVVAVVVRL